jgi:arabinogalactan endo-1,4-beta-galactosidase
MGSASVARLCSGINAVLLAAACSASNVGAPQAPAAHTAPPVAVADAGQGAAAAAVAAAGEGAAAVGAIATAGGVAAESGDARAVAGNAAMPQAGMPAHTDASGRAAPQAGAPASAGMPAADGGVGQPAPTFYLGADITDQEPEPAPIRAKLLDSMLAHGFNAIRLRTFVDPRAEDGYDRENGYADLAHTIDFGKQIKAAGMLLAVDFHYSDNWADPGKQCVPIAWQKLTTITELANALGEYTRDAVTQLVAAGARPDLVQIGNEITPGMLLHRCDARGLPTAEHNVRGSTERWSDLGALLQAGVDAVRSVDPTILISLHIDRGGDKASDTPGSALAVSLDWLAEATKYVRIDAFGQSCYQRYQGDPASVERSQSTWRATFAGIAQRYPALQLFAAEYGPAQREINDVVYELADRQGLGTFNWQPTTQGDWNTGHVLWQRQADGYRELPDLELYKVMKQDYAERL